MVSMGDVGGPGGYWMPWTLRVVAGAGDACPARSACSPASRCCGRLWRGIGVGWGRVQRGDNADMWSTLSDYDARGRGRLDAFLDRIYEAFEVAARRRAGRMLPGARRRKGRARARLTGAQAKRAGPGRRARRLRRARSGPRSDRGGAGAAAGAATLPAAGAPWQQALELLGGERVGLAALRSALVRWLAVLGVLSAPPLTIR